VPKPLHKGWQHCCYFLWCYQAIVDYREMEKKEWSEKNKAIIQRMRELAFEPGMPQLEHVHVLDVLPEGCIKAHIDSVRVSSGSSRHVSISISVSISIKLLLNLDYHVHLSTTCIPSSQFKWHPGKLKK